MAYMLILLRSQWQLVLIYVTVREKHLTLCSCSFTRVTQNMLIVNYFAYKYFVNYLHEIYEQPCSHAFLVNYSNTFTDPDRDSFIPISRHSVMHSGVLLWLTTYQWMKVLIFSAFPQNTCKKDIYNLYSEVDDSNDMLFGHLKALKEATWKTNKQKK